MGFEREPVSFEQFRADEKRVPGVVDLCARLEQEQDRECDRKDSRETRIRH